MKTVLIGELMLYFDSYFPNFCIKLNFNPFFISAFLILCMKQKGVHAHVHVCEFKVRWFTIIKVENILKIGKSKFITRL